MESNFTYVCTVDRISLSQFDQGQLTSLGNGHAVLFINPAIGVLVVQCFDYCDEEIASIVLTSESQAWLQNDHNIIVDRPAGGLWRLDCVASDPLAFSIFQDALTYTIQYENRHHMRNTLAWMSQDAYRITDIVATDVLLDDEGQDITGKKHPVTVTKSPEKAYKVNLLYQTSGVLMTGSDWIAQAFVMAGQTLAQGIQRGTDMLEHRVVPVAAPIKLTDSERKCIDIFSQTTGQICQVGENLIGRAVSATVSGINARYSDAQLESSDPMQNATRHFGMSAIQATTNIIGGVAAAATEVLASSRDGIARALHRKYGEDALYIAKKTIGVPDVLVYFDAHGISRSVANEGTTTRFSQFVRESNISTEEAEEVEETKDIEETESQISYTDNEGGSTPQFVHV
ncbi:hypothetical protein DFQ28_002732 [Apophysomyces sp. BC1034]|nr:hypothetical protein DFQ30_005566 [Apophysomyces sp. BC1015]KAG0179510.1 hypothetical protein DFQ29_002017 [Apophysomyces sp. BC1021]KAG0189911.1 hypothetical protein DFQ28_002732 [Apophysomyces sp. BC1034]